jgi:enoyl-CoA hydratase
MSESQAVHTELSEHVLTITMDRPGARNALNRQMIADLAAAYTRLNDEDDCRVAVIQAEGPAFCAGADLKEALSDRRDRGQGEPSGPARVRRAGESSIPRRRKPLIACVEGHAYAGGLELLMTCDMIVASTDATFALSEVRRGLMATGGGLFRLPRRLPETLAMEMVLTGAPQPADVMYGHGLLNRLTPPGEARKAARQLALAIAENSPVAVQAALEVATRSVAERWTDVDAVTGMQEPAQRVWSSADLMEGLQAFSEKRAPEWKGR